MCPLVFIFPFYHCHIYIILFNSVSYFFHISLLALLPLLDPSSFTVILCLCFISIIFSSFLPTFFYSSSSTSSYPRFRVFFIIVINIIFLNSVSSFFSMSLFFPFFSVVHFSFLLCFSYSLFHLHIFSLFSPNIISFLIFIFSPFLIFFQSFVSFFRTLLVSNIPARRFTLASLLFLVPFLHFIQPHAVQKLPSPDCNISVGVVMV